MLPMEKSVTFTDACANEIISNGYLARLLAKRKKEVMLKLKLDLLAHLSSISPISLFHETFYMEKTNIKLVYFPPNFY